MLSFCNGEGAGLNVICIRSVANLGISLLLQKEAILFYIGTMCHGLLD